MIEGVLLLLAVALVIGVGFTAGYSLAAAHHKSQIARLQGQVAMYKAAADGWQKRFKEGGSRD